MFKCRSSTLAVWLIRARFLAYYSPFWGPEAISIVVEPQGALTCRSSTLIVLVVSDPFCRLLLTVLGSRRHFHPLINPGMRLHVSQQHSQFWPILARFMDSYSLFWGPGVISTINGPQGGFTCRSSTLTVLANSDPFGGLLVPVLGSRSDFHSC